MAMRQRLSLLPLLTFLGPAGAVACSGASPRSGGSNSGYETSGSSATTGASGMAGSTGNNGASGTSGSTTGGSSGTATGGTSATGGTATGGTATTSGTATGTAAPSGAGGNASGASGTATGVASGAASGDAASSSGSTTGTATATTDGGAAATGDAGTGCPGVPIVPDADGFVAPGSNSVGIHGSWFTYSDCTDLKGVNCATVTSPTGTGFANVGGKICTSGMTSDATGAWGAGIGLELSDGPPQQPYDTVANGVKGFCFVLSGTTIPTTSIRVAFPTQDNNDNAYFEAVTTPGMHTVLFSDTAQGSWVTSKAAFEPTKVMLMQFQIPSSTTAPVPWDFCVEGVTAVMQ